MTASMAKKRTCERLTPQNKKKYNLMVLLQYLAKCFNFETFLKVMFVLVNIGFIFMAVGSFLIAAGHSVIYELEEKSAEPAKRLLTASLIGISLSILIIVLGTITNLFCCRLSNKDLVEFPKWKAARRNKHIAKTHCGIVFFGFGVVMLYVFSVLLLILSRCCFRSADPKQR